MNVVFLDSNWPPQRAAALYFWPPRASVASSFWPEENCAKEEGVNGFEKVNRFRPSEPRQAAQAATPRAAKLVTFGLDSSATAT